MPPWPPPPSSNLSSERLLEREKAPLTEDTAVSERLASGPRRSEMVPDLGGAQLKGLTVAAPRSRDSRGSELASSKAGGARRAGRAQRTASYDLSDDEEALKGSSKGRGRYKCQKCGMPKRGHGENAGPARPNRTCGRDIHALGSASVPPKPPCAPPPAPCFHEGRRTLRSG
jgi:hypothetical protein